MEVMLIVGLFPLVFVIGVLTGMWIMVRIHKPLVDDIRQEIGAPFVESGSRV